MAILKIMFLLIILPFEFLNRLIMIWCGFQEPYLQTAMHLSHNWKSLRGITPYYIEPFFVDNGYMYQKVIYTDGSELYFL